LGTADFTNFVYSFGLTFGILVSTLQGILLFAYNFLSFSERPNAWIKFRKLFLIAAIAVAAILVYGLVAPNAYTPNLLRLGNPWVFVVVFSTMSIMGLMANYLWFRYRVIKLEDL
jgi:hypothetical protein